MNWSYVLAVVVVFGGLAAINELTGSNLGWFLAIAILLGIFLKTGIGTGPIAWLTGQLGSLANRAKGGT